MRVALAVAIGVLSSTLHGQGQEPKPRTAEIAGQVVDAVNGRPIGGAIVALNSPQFSPSVSARPAPPLWPRTLTGSDGRFVFRELAGGTYSITAVKPGYADGAYGRRRPNGPSHQITIADGERAANAALRMWKFGSISGTIVDEAGEPVVAVAVRAFRRSVVAGIRRFVDGPTTTTDDRGIYRIPNLIPGEYTVAVVTRQMAAPLSVAAEGATRSELMEMAIALPGTSIEIAGAAYSIGLGSPIPPPPQDGRILVYPTTYYPAARSAAQATVVAIASAEERSGIDFQLTPVPTVRVSGVLSGPQGPLSTPVRLEPPDAPDITQRDGLTAVVSARNGEFIFPAVPAGDYILRVSGAARQGSTPAFAPSGDVFWFEQPIAVGRDDISGLNIVLQPGLRVSGRFEFEGATGATDRPQPQQLQQISLAVESTTAGAFGIRQMARADAGGQFASGGLAGGKYFVRVLGSPTGWMFKSAMLGGRDVSDVPFDLTSDVSGVVITFTDRWSGLSGNVRTAQGAAVGDALVVLFPTDSQLWTAYGQNFRRMKSTQTTENGQYTFPVVAPGDYYAAAIRDSDAGDWQDPAFLEMLARSAPQVRIGEGEKKALDLRTQEVR